ncbi:MAG: DNA polymerase ligase N-terminal domain-containing protein, partial [Candidatus Micrarchaeia archaeon]
GGPGFFFVLYKNQPIYAIGGSDGISNILNVSLSRTPNYVIMDKEYEVLEKWKDVYKKPLLKPSRNNLITPELYQQHRSTILNKINNKEKLTNFEWQLLLTYLNDDKDIDKVKLLENVVTYPYSIARGDGDYIERAELAVFVAQAIVKDSYENIDLPEDLLKKLQNIIGKDYYASIDYLIKVAKGYKEKYKPYREGIFDEFDPNDADDIEDLFKLLRLHGFELTEEEKQKFLENIGLIVIKTIKNNLGDLEYLLQKLNLSIDDVVSKISAHPTDSYEFARYLIENNKEVPDKIIDGISRDPNSSYYFAEDLIKNNKEVPDKIIDSLQKDKKQEILQLIQPNNQTVVQSWSKTTSVYEKYIQKRKFDKTPEPEPDITAETALLSYAIPKSKIPEKGEKLLAIETELHPIEYLIFEGIIPKGEYGGGQIKVYDKGKYRIVDANPKRMIIELEGGKVKGKFAIVHTKDKNYLFTRVQ